jgi:environmental stress-induced protein Ves
MSGSAAQDTAMGAPTLYRIRLADIAPQAWKNGGGATRELLVWPPGAAADGWSLRLSIATIDRDGPFSPFDGIQRHFAVVEGAGVALAWGSGTRWVCRGDRPVVFDGANAPHARLLAGTTQDINLMLRRTHGRGVLQAAQAGVPWTTRAPWRAFYAARDVQLRVDDGAAESLPAHTLLWCENVPATGGQALGDHTSTWTLAAPPSADPTGWWMAFTPHHFSEHP